MGAEEPNGVAGENGSEDALQGGGSENPTAKRAAEPTELRRSQRYVTPFIHSRLRQDAPRETPALLRTQVPSAGGRLGLEKEEAFFFAGGVRARGRPASKPPPSCGPGPAAWQMRQLRVDRRS
ncbi:UNVERIFIED_CONTAM: hypothetical protein K2H54_000514 [Gekko kuhli]